MASVDREMAALGEERAEKSKRLNLKRMQHVSTLQQLSKYFFVTFRPKKKCAFLFCKIVLFVRAIIGYDNFSFLRYLCNNNYI